MNNEQQLEMINISMDNAKKAIELGNALERLHKNPDFQKVILTDFFRDEASRTVMLKSDPNMQQKDQQKIVDSIIIGIGALYQYFGKVYRLAERSIQAIEDDQKTREEILEENLTDDEL